MEYLLIVSVLATILVVSVGLTKIQKMLESFMTQMQALMAEATMGASNRDQRETAVSVTKATSAKTDATVHEDADAAASSDETATGSSHYTGSRDLLVQTLEKLGCPWDQKQDDDDKRIHFVFQGEHFLANADNERPYVGLWDVHWGSVELYDIDEISRLRKAINEANLNNSVTTVFTIDDSGKEMDVHCKATILFVREIPHLDDYLKVELNEFFNAHHLVGSEMKRLRATEEESGN